jgi:hypothetical protein
MTQEQDATARNKEVFSRYLETKVAEDEGKDRVMISPVVEELLDSFRVEEERKRAECRKTVRAIVEQFQKRMTRALNLDGFIFGGIPDDMVEKLVADAERVKSLEDGKRVYDPRIKITIETEVIDLD